MYVLKGTLFWLLCLVIGLDLVHGEHFDQYSQKTIFVGIMEMEASCHGKGDDTTVQVED